MRGLDQGGLLVRGERLDPIDEAVEPPAIEVGTRERRVGYTSGVTLPSDFFPCTQAPGFWDHTYAEGAFVAVALPPDHVIDVLVRPEGEAAFAPVTSANQIALEAFGGDSVDVDLFGPPGAEDAFVVHARLRRLADGAVSDVVSGPCSSIPPRRSAPNGSAAARGPRCPAPSRWGRSSWPPRAVVVSAEHVVVVCRESRVVCRGRGRQRALTVSAASRS